MRQYFINSYNPIFLTDFIDPLLRLQTDASLFVASAANQMLAHVLLSFQDGERTRSSAEYASVVTAISEHLKVSLVPQKYTELRQSLQVLKLLALVLARAGPPLWDRLLQAVADSLEELAAAGCSQLTLPLMDVILAARR